MWKYIAALTVISGALTARADAQGIGFGVHGGYITGFTNESLEQSIKDNISDFELKNSMTDLGAHLDISALHSIGFDVFFDYAWKEQEVNNDIKVRHSIASLTASATVGFPLVMVTPYIGGGLGYYRIIQSVSADNIHIVLPSDSNRAGWHAKLGVALNPPAFPVAPFLEWRYSNINMPGDDIKYNSIVLGVTLGASK